jgi:UDP-N-acetylmuramate: L-alanyl-gamma-D-glutamyl-meso-diaminopimelate ligase
VSSFSLKPGSRIYFLAICGTGMSALAGLLKERGFIVRGSDVAAYPPVGDLLKKLDIPVDLGFEVEAVQAFKPDYVVIGNFIRRDNPQAQYVLSSGIRYGSFPSTLEDFFLQETQNFVVVGTHGKTTTTSCLAHILAHAGRDPSFLIGGVPHNFGKSFHVGQGKDFVIEGDEYDTAFFDKESKFLHYRPKIAILQSLEFDHADIFSSMEMIEKMFRKFLRLLPANGKLFYCRDWERLSELVLEEKQGGHLLADLASYGFHDEADHLIQDFQDSEDGIQWRVGQQRLKAQVSGKFNAQNLTSAYLAARAAGVTDVVAAEGLESFSGVKRRQEVVGRVGGHLVIDDFAHHPTAVRRVLEGLRAHYPKHRIVTFFEPRSNTSRRNILQREFESAFDLSDYTMIAELFHKEMIHEAERLDLESIRKAHASRGAQVEVGMSVDQMIQRAVELSKKDQTAFVILSNGAFDDLHQKLISALKAT